jgi:hypothetical protein
MNQADASLQAAQQAAMDEYLRRLYALAGANASGKPPQQVTQPQPQAAPAAPATAGGKKATSFADALDAVSQGAGLVMAARDAMPIPPAPNTHAFGSASSVGPVKSTSTDWMVQRDPRAQQATLADLLQFLSRKVG